MATNAKLNTYASGDVDLTNIMSVLDATRLGLLQTSITEMNSTTVPAIAAGSYMEVGGSLFPISTEEAISTTDPVTSATVANGTCYIVAIPSGSDITFAFTATAPTWSDAKQGWYGTGSYATHKYLFRLYKTSASNYNSKFKIKQIKTTVLQVEFEIVMVVGALSGQSVGANSTARLSTTPSETIDTHSAFASGSFTVPARGVYQLSFITYSGGMGVFSFCKNSSGLYTFFNAQSGEYNTYYAALECGDVIDIYFTETGGSISASVSVPHLEYRLVLPL